MLLKGRVSSTVVSPVQPVVDVNAGVLMSHNRKDGRFPRKDGDAEVNDELSDYLNEQAMEQMIATKKMVIVSGATHFFEEPGALESAARLASQWFRLYLTHGAAPKGEA